MGCEECVGDGRAMCVHGEGIGAEKVPVPVEVGEVVRRGGRRGRVVTGDDVREEDRQAVAVSIGVGWWVPGACISATFLVVPPPAVFFIIYKIINNLMRKKERGESNGSRERERFRVGYGR